MNKKFLFAAAIASMAIMASCSDKDNTIEGAVEPAVTETSSDYAGATDDAPLAVYLTDQDGNRVENLSGEFGIYNLHIEGAEAWIIQTNQAFVSVLKNQGTGRAVVPVYVATSWGESRQAQISVKTLDLDAPATRGAGSSDDTQIAINQEAAYTPVVIKRYGSNTGVGFAYNPLRSDNLMLAIGQPVFDIEALSETKYQKDDVNYTNNEDLIIASSDSALHNQLMIKGGVSGKFSTIAFSGSGSFNKVHSTDQSQWHSVMSKNTVVFQREILYADLLASENKYLSAGFKMFSEELKSSIAAANGDKAKVRKAIDDFFSHFGPYFIYRAQVGAHLDYTCTINKSLCKDSLDIAAAVQFKYKKEVVDTTAVDTTATKKKAEEGGNSGAAPTPNSQTSPNEEAIERFFAENSVNAANAAANAEKEEKNDKEEKEEKEYKTFDAEGAAKYQDFISNVAENTDAKLEIKGGTNGVSILANGGKLTPEDLEVWTKNITIGNAVIGDFLVAPIYYLFDKTKDAATYNYLKEYIDEGEIK